MIPGLANPKDLEWAATAMERNKECPADICACRDYCLEALLSAFDQAQETDLCLEWRLDGVEHLAKEVIPT